MRVFLDVKTCKECPFIRHERTEGAGYALDYTCAFYHKPRMIAGYVEYSSEFPTQIPSWCPFRSCSDEMYTAYYYDPNKDQGFPGDCNELWVDNRFLSFITECRTSSDIEDLIATPALKKHLILIANKNVGAQIINRNPNPDEI